MTTDDLIKVFLFELALAKAKLLEERAAMLNANARITEIDADIAKLDIELQPTLDKVNAIDKTAVTLLELAERARPTKPAPIPASVDPVQVAVLAAEKLNVPIVIGGDI